MAMARETLKVIIFGAGEAARHAVGCFSNRVEVLAVADNDPTKHGTLFMGYPVIAPAQIRGMPYHCIVVASMHAKQIAAQLLAIGVADDDIEFPPSNEHFTFESRGLIALAWLGIGGAIGAGVLAWYMTR
jgi:hypothetical protein